MKILIFFFLNKKVGTFYINIGKIQHCWGCQLSRLNRKPRQLDIPVHISSSLQSRLRVTKLTLLSPARRKPGVTKLKLVFAAKTKAYRKLAVLRKILVRQNHKQSWGLNIR